MFPNKKKEKHKSEQKRVVCSAVKAAVHQADPGNRDQKQNTMREKFGNRKNTAEKKSCKNYDLPRMSNRFFLQGNGNFLSGEKQKNADQKKNCSTQSIGQHHKQKLQKGKSGKRIQIKILRIADRSKHTAKVCSHGHKGDKKYFFLLHMAHSQKQNAKRNKGNQSDIIGNQHAAEKAQGNQKQSNHPF